MSKPIQPQFEEVEVCEYWIRSPHNPYGWADHFWVDWDVFYRFGVAPRVGDKYPMVITP